MTSDPNAFLQPEPPSDSPIVAAPEAAHGAGTLGSLFQHDKVWILVYAFHAFLEHALQVGFSLHGCHVQQVQQALDPVHRGGAQPVTHRNAAPKIGDVAGVHILLRWE